MSLNFEEEYYAFNYISCNDIGSISKYMNTGKICSGIDDGFNYGDNGSNTGKFIDALVGEIGVLFSLLYYNDTKEEKEEKELLLLNNVIIDQLDL